MLRKLQSASRKLDREKVKAEKNLRKLLEKIGRLDEQPVGILERASQWVKVIISLETNARDKVPVKKFIKAAKRVQTTRNLLLLRESSSRKKASKIVSGTNTLASHPESGLVRIFYSSRKLLGFVLSPFRIWRYDASCFDGSNRIRKEHDTGRVRSQPSHRPPG